MQVTDTVDNQYFEPSISFDIELLHSCRRTAFEAFTIDPITYQLRNGQNQDLEQEVPKDPVSSKFGNLDGWTTCGPRTYYIEDLSDNTESTWVTIAEDTSTPGETFFLRVSIDEESYVGDYNFRLTIGFENYPLADDPLHPIFTVDFEVTVVAAECDCSLISWDEPGNIPDLLDALVSYEA